MPNGNQIILPPGNYYIGDLHLLTLRHGLAANQLQTIENLAVTAAPMPFSGALNGHAYLALTVALRGELFRQILVTNMDISLGFDRHQINVRRETGILVAIHYESLTQEAMNLANELPCLCWRFEDPVPVTFTGPTLYLDMVEINTGQPVEPT